jgi:hypothetical protein
MKTLTTEIANVLNNPNVRTGLNIAKIEATSLISKKKSKSSFEDTFKLARLINDSAEYFKTKECKQIFASNGLTWKLEDFFNHLGFQKQWCYKLIKAVKLEFKVIQEDKKEAVKINVLENYLKLDLNGYSIIEFIKFANGEPKKEAEKSILNISYGDIKVKINAKNELVSTTTEAELKAIITRLTAELDRMQDVKLMFNL